MQPLSHRHHGSVKVGVIGRADKNRVEVRTLEHFPKIVKLGGLWVILGHLGKVSSVDITKRDDVLLARRSDVVNRSIPHADRADV